MDLIKSDKQMVDALKLLFAKRLDNKEVNSTSNESCIKEADWAALR